MISFLIQTGKNFAGAALLVPVIVLYVAVISAVEKRFPSPPNDRISGDW